MTDLKEHLAGRIRQYLTDLVQVQERVLKVWDAYEKTKNEFLLDSVALNLQNFYSAVENMLKAIAERIDGHLPIGENWHSELLGQLSTEVSGLRPAVISHATKEGLSEYRSFRHIVRNIYAFNMDPRKIKPLIDKLPTATQGLQKELIAFLALLGS
ncbi:MAG: hypothetical protein A2268_15280 [Candidatus Raymondbacteria bacterium RifOxyA12_full_50_37]|uniref:HepT-like domain-containing protein n=1 Tax=Candidatus Raymondbacteria bacterium RIFOXYD12_FULL_49_13 TaxID=1817890 RepID=A0A1F7F778_UNCRA|nr:MAG: hypothetical protein A2268_15280 [Candidatus Raymondbacteria bacterium RifOxyA12_full_50_37]OGJ88484.1 MAG: hypothetical protein A2248_19985 [Candidatus Raymondbacteria bacterium RIFOXYA2_FULL_49_16]OGJ90634.1 MAG: hypothetical protein A2350_18530 [Candidatus Raymondbacteria bacterium RifOxyB12_full_50_8]OGJ96204.1 MAG: hypothetical protein A2487_01460 [Candidatus Raymondbacteria bacterium RifOxyC12_full_50_8]OGJ98944.1 MAG: hypothetical protein A2453_10700 [Candidatus Raymondbacteria b